VCTEETKEDKVEEQHFMEAWTIQKDTREENVVLKEKQLSTKV
jgi:hypothetical protein